MELNNFETLDRHPLHTEAVSANNDWSVPKHPSWDDDSMEKSEPTIIVVELPTCATDNKKNNKNSSNTINSIAPLSVSTDDDGSGTRVDYLELGLFGLMVFAVAIVILRD